MDLEQVKTTVKEMNTEDRRKLALFILELEKQHLQDTVGPQIKEDVDALSKVVQDAADRIKKLVKEHL